MTCDRSGMDRKVEAGRGGSSAQVQRVYGRAALHFKEAKFWRAITTRQRARYERIAREAHRLYGRDVAVTRERGALTPAARVARGSVKGPSRWC